MSRIARLLHRPRRTLAALATVLAATGLTAASGADFTATAANPANTFTAGTLAVSNSADNVAILSATNLKPGGSAQTGTVDIANAGTLSGAFTLTRGTVDDSDATNKLSEKLHLVVRDCGEFDGDDAPSCAGADEVYAGTLAAMDAAVALGAYDAEEKHRFHFEVALDGSAGNAYQGASSTVTFSWNAA